MRALPPTPNAAPVWQPVPTSTAWINDVMQVLKFLLAHLVPLAASNSKLQLYCDYWSVRTEYLSSGRVQSWEQWLGYTDPRTAVPPSLHQHGLELLGQRLYTHLGTITYPLKNMTPAAERHDIPTCLVRRAWTSHLVLKTFHERMRKLCVPGRTGRVSSRASDGESRYQCLATLKRLHLAVRLGFLRLPSTTAGSKTRLTHYERTRLLTQWNSPLRTVEWDTELAPFIDTIAEALQTYVRTYVQSCPILRKALRKHFPDWPNGPLWIPGPALVFVRATLLTLKNIRKPLLLPPNPANPWERDAEAVLHAAAEAPRRYTDTVVVQVLAQWHGMAASAHDLVEFMRQYEKGKLSKAGLKRLLARWQNDEPRTLDWLLSVIRVWHRHMSIYTVPVPYDWTLRVSDNYARLERQTGFTISPMIDVFLYCPVCLRVCSIAAPFLNPATRSAGGRGDPEATKKKRKTSAAATAAKSSSSGSAGFRKVVVDVDHGGRLMCASRKTGLNALRCTQTELQQIHLTGQMLYFYGRVFLLCPQPHCGRLMQLESTSPVNPFGPSCSLCARGLTPAVIAEEKRVATVREFSDSEDEAAETAVQAGERLFDSDDED